MRPDELEQRLGDIDCLFHYTTIEAALEHILPDETLRFSPVRSTNDPREYKEWSFMGVGSIPKSGSNHLHLLEINAAINTLVGSEYKVACFSQNTEDRAGYLKSRMWSQYGQSHGGVCVVFSKSKLISSLRNWPSQESPFYDEVTYTAEMKIHADALVVSLDELEREPTDSVARKHAIEHNRELFFTKHSDYKDECEYRLVIHDCEPGYSFVKTNECIMSIPVNSARHSGGKLPPGRWCEPRSA